MNLDRPERADRLAAEFVLGTLHGGARRRFRQQLLRSRVLQDAVKRWERQLTPAAARLDGPAPADRVWRAIEARIHPSSTRPSSTSASRSADAGASRGPSAASPAEGGSWWQRWFGLRPLSMLGAGLAAGVLGMVVLPQLQGPTGEDGVPPGRVLPESYAGILLADDGRPSLLVGSRRHGKVVDLKVLRPLAVPPGQVAQLWALVPGQAPLRLGVVPLQGKAQLTLPDTSEKLLAKATELAVSIEPAELATPAAPAQPWLLRGPCAKFW